MTAERRENTSGAAPALKTYHVVDATLRRVSHVRAHSVFVDLTGALNIVVDGNIVRRFYCDFWAWVLLPTGRFIAKPWHELKGQAA